LASYGVANGCRGYSETAPVIEAETSRESVGRDLPPTLCADTVRITLGEMH